MFRDTEKPGWFIDNRVGVGVSQIPHAGVGCFALEDIPARTMIEASPVIICAPNTFSHLNQIHKNVRHILSDYPFHWPDGNRAFALGWAGIYNHSASGQNLQWAFKTVDKDGYDALCFTTKKNILKGEELLVRYHPNSDKLWFVDESTADNAKIPLDITGHSFAKSASPGMQLDQFVRKQHKRKHSVKERPARETIGNWGPSILNDEE